MCLCVRARLCACVPMSLCVRVCLCLPQGLWLGIVSRLEACEPCPIPHALVWLSIPPRIRGRIWPALIGNAAHCTPELYDMCLYRAKRLRKMQSQAAARQAADHRFAVVSSAQSSPLLDPMQQEPFSLSSFSFGHEDTLPVCVCVYPRPTSDCVLPPTSCVYVCLSLSPCAVDRR